MPHPDRCGCDSCWDEFLDFLNAPYDPQPDAAEADEAIRDQYAEMIGARQ